MGQWFNGIRHQGRMVIWGLLLGVGMMMAMAIPAMAASSSTLIWSQASLNAYDITPINLYQGDSTSGWVHIQTNHPLQDGSLLTNSSFIQTEVGNPAQQTLETSTVLDLGSDFTYVVNGTSQTMTVYVVVADSGGVWKVITAYPMQTGVTRNGIVSDTNFTIQKNTSTGKTMWPNWANSSGILTG